MKLTNTQLVILYVLTEERVSPTNKEEHKLMLAFLNALHDCYMEYVKASQSIQARMRAIGERAKTLDFSNKKKDETEEAYEERKKQMEEAKQELTDKLAELEEENKENVAKEVEVDIEQEQIQKILDMIYEQKAVRSRMELQSLIEVFNLI